MMNAKRMGMVPRAYRNVHLRTAESFDPNFKFKPFYLYSILTEDGDYAITTDINSADVYLAKPDKDNKMQWVLIDGDTGVICFFSDLLSYMNIELKQGIIAVKRADTLTNGKFQFNVDNTIVFRDHKDYQLAYRKSKAVDTPAAAPAPAAAAPAATPETPAAPAEGAAEGGEGAAEGGETPNGPTEKPAESFLYRLYESFMEAFDPKNDPVLEAVEISEVKKNPSNFVTKWQYKQLMDLRDQTNALDTLAEYEKKGASETTQITKLKNSLETQKELSEIEIRFRDNKIKRYEENPFIKKFL